MQDFLWQVQKRGLDDSLTASNSSSSGRSDKPLTLDVFNTIVDSYEAKKKYALILLRQIGTVELTTSQALYASHHQSFVNHRQGRAGSRDEER